MQFFARLKPQQSKTGADAETLQADGVKLAHVVWYRDAGLRKLYALTAIIIISSATNGYDGSMMNGLQLVDFWQNYFHHPNGSLLGLFNCIYSVGNICALPFAPYLQDRYGRRLTIIAGCMVLFLGVALQAGSQNFRMFIASRFFVGFGCSLAQNAAPLLLTELCHPQHRARVTAIYNTFYNVGSIAATWITFGTFSIQSEWSWRIPSLLQALPSLAQFCLIWLVPESPRWLISQDRNEEALNILARYHANGNRNDPTVIFEFSEIRETLYKEQIVNKTSHYVDFLKTKGNRYRLFLLITAGVFSQWSGNGLTSYYFGQVMISIGVTDRKTQFEINGGQVILSLLIGLVAAALVDRVGRRPLFLTATTGMLVSFSLWTACSALYELDNNVAAGRAVIACMIIHGSFYNLAWSGLLFAYSVEILPYKLRAKGIMIMILAVQGAAVFNQYVNPIGLDNLYPHWKFYIIYCFWIAVELLVVFFAYVETRGPTLEEIVKIFDGDDAIVGGVDIETATAVSAAGIKAAEIEVEHQEFGPNEKV